MTTIRRSCIPLQTDNPATDHPHVRVENGGMSAENVVELLREVGRLLRVAVRHLEYKRRHLERTTRSRDTCKM